MRLERRSALLACAFVLIGAAWGAYLGLRHVAGLDSGLDRVEYLTLDWRALLAGPRTPPRGVVIAAIDDDAVRAIGAYPVPRERLAEIVRELLARGPQTVGLDVLFLDPGKADADAALADALRGARTVIGAVGMFEAGQQRGVGGELQDVPAPSRLMWPIDALSGAAQAGLVNLSTDHAGVPRFIPMLFRSGDRLFPSLVLALSAAALSTEPSFGGDTVRLAGHTVTLDLGYHLPIRYYGPRGTIAQFSLARLIRHDLDPALVRGQVVLIGATATGTGDAFATPFDRSVPGVEILATAISNLLAGDGLVRNATTRKADAAAAIVLPALLVLLLALRRAALGVAAAALVLIAWLVIAQMAFMSGIWLAVAVPLAAALPPAALFGIARMIGDRRRAERFAGEAAALAKFQSPILLQHIRANPRFLEQPLQQDVAVVFLDLSGFTGVAEALGPRWTHELMAAFQEIVEHDVRATSGYVVDFAGDGAMILFGLPQAAPDDGTRALRTIVQLRRSITTWFASLPPAAQNALSVRIGGHFGPAMLSRLGASDHQRVAATGDTVNAAHRLLEIAKQDGASAVVTEDLWQASSAADQAAVKPSAPTAVEVRGRSHGLVIRTLEDAS